MFEKVFVAIVSVVLIASVCLAIYVCGFSEFNKRTYEGHTYIFYGDKPIEHDVECKKCLDRFD